MMELASSAGMIGFQLFSLLIALLPLALAVLIVYYLAKIHGELKEIKGLIRKQNQSSLDR